MAWFMVFVFGWSLLATSIAVNDFVGLVTLDNCNIASIDIRKNENNTLVCRGFSPNATVTWSIHRNPTTDTPSMKVAACDPSNCTVYQTEHFAVQRLPSQSHTKLFYQQYNASLDIGAEIKCASTLGHQRSEQSCTLNVITPATDTTQASSSFPGTAVGVSVGIPVAVVVVVVVVIKKRKDTTYGKPRRRRNAEDEHVYSDLHSTNTTVPTLSGSTLSNTPDELQTNKDNPFHGQNNPVYVNDNGTKPNPVYVNDASRGTDGHLDDDRDSSVYYSEIKDNIHAD